MLGSTSYSSTGYQRGTVEAWTVSPVRRATVRLTGHWHGPAGRHVSSAGSRPGQAPQADTVDSRAPTDGLTSLAGRDAMLPTSTETHESAIGQFVWRTAHELAMRITQNSNLISADARYSTGRNVRKRQVLPPPPYTPVPALANRVTTLYHCPGFRPTGRRYRRSWSARSAAETVLIHTNQIERSPPHHRPESKCRQ